jgi:hypothetical protein
VQHLLLGKKGMIIVEAKRLEPASLGSVPITFHSLGKENYSQDRAQRNGNFKYLSSQDQVSGRRNREKPVRPSFLCRRRSMEVAVLEPAPTIVCATHRFV